MLIDVRPILHIPGKELNFQFELDLSDMEFGGRNPISRPVIVEGAVRNRAEVLYLELTAHTTLDAVCDRCGKEFLQEKAVSYGCILAEKLQNEEDDEILLLEDGKVDVGELAREAFILDMDTKTLCSEELHQAFFLPILRGNKSDFQALAHTPFCLQVCGGSLS